MGRCDFGRHSATVLLSSNCVTTSKARSIPELVVRARDWRLEILASKLLSLALHSSEQCISRRFGVGTSADISLLPRTSQDHVYLNRIIGMGGNVALIFYTREKRKSISLSLTLIAVAPKGPTQIPIAVARKLADRASHECAAGDWERGEHKLTVASLGLHRTDW
jgi:hypothetical protein